MKKLVSTIAMLLLIIPVFFSCESLTGDLQDISGPQSDITTLEEGGVEDDGELPPDGGQ